MQNVCYLNKFIHPYNAQNNNFYNLITVCVVVELFSLKDACSFITEAASFYVMVELGQ